MEFSNQEAILEAILFASGKEVATKKLSDILKISESEVDEIATNLKIKYDNLNCGIELVKLNKAYQLCTRKEYYEYIYPLFENKSKVNISTSALEVLTIIAYNPNITRAQIEFIRGVSSDSMINKLLDYELIEESGKLDAPGKPCMYKVTNKFLKSFGISSESELPELPRYDLDNKEEANLNV